MFDKFGEFDSVEELNAAAAGFKNEGDMESLKALAVENGIEPEDAEDYIDGMQGALALNVIVAAFGKLRVEEQEIDKGKDVMEKMARKVILEFVKGMCVNEDFCKLVLHKGKRVADIYGGMRDAASKHKSGNAGMCCGTDRQLALAIKAYYENGKAGLNAYLESLY